MEHELNGIKRTFPKKKSGGKNEINGFKVAFLKKERKGRANRNAAPISVDAAEDAILKARKKVKYVC